MTASIQDGDWDDIATWVGGVVPGIGATAEVNHEVTATTNLTVGTSPSDNTTYVITVNSGGKLIGAEDVIVTARGNVFNGVGDPSPEIGISLGPGGKLEFDPSNATTPSTIYRLNHERYAITEMQGTALNPTTLSTVEGVGLGHAQVTQAFAGIGATFLATYAHFDRLSSFKSKSRSATYALITSFENCIFDGCGAVTISADGVGSSMIYNNNKHINSLGNVIIEGTAGNTGTVNFEDNVFDSIVTFNPPGQAISRRNYFHKKSSTLNVTSASADFSVWENNFIRSDSGGAYAWDANMLDSMLLEDTNNNNPSVISAMATGRDTSLNGCIVDSTGTAVAGDYILPQGTGGFKHIFTHNLFLPQSQGKSPGKFISNVFEFPDTVMDILNNTYITHDEGVTAIETGVGVGESDVGHVGEIAEFFNNLAWTYPGIPPGWKIVRQQSLKQDFVLSANADYNWGWNLAAGSEGNGYTVWSTFNGTSLFSSGTPDVNGGNGDPAFVDHTRNTARYDTDGLGNVETPWADSTVYTAGDMRATESADFYFNDTINFRCITDHTSAAGDPALGKPGVGVDWRDNWELATLYRLRENTSLISDLITWIKGGFAPTNTALKETGLGGIDIGAVSVVAALASAVSISVGRFRGIAVNNIKKWIRV